MKLFVPAGEPAVQARRRLTAGHGALAVAAAWLAGFGVLYAMTGITVFSLFSVAPLIVATVASERRTAVFGGAAVALTLAAGWWQDTATDASYWIRVAVVCVISAMAVVLAGMRLAGSEEVAQPMAGPGPEGPGPPATRKGNPMHLRSRFSRLVAVAAACAALALAGTGIAAASSSGPDITTAVTLHLSIRGGTTTFVNVRHLRHPAVGDEVIISQPVFNADNGQQVGHGWVVVTLTGGISSQDSATLSLIGGQVTASGIQQSNPFQLAVTGGTGRYQNARGQATVHLTGRNSAQVTLSLLP